MRLLLVLGLASALGCAVPIKTSTTKLDAPVKVQKIALVPFETGRPFLPKGQDAEQATRIVTARVLGAITDRTDFVIVPPEEASRYLAGLPEGETAGRASLAVELQRGFATEAALFGTVRRFVTREGGPRGSKRPAGVWFDLELRSPFGIVLWTGSYEETQQGLSDDLLSLRRALSRRFKWVSANQLAQYGAEQLADDLAGAQDQWR
jgi:hypothetical protein